MRFLSVVALSGCAIIDAGGDPHGLVAGGNQPSFTSKKIGGFNGNVSVILAADLDDNTSADFAALSGGTLSTAVSSGNGDFTVRTVEAGYTSIGVGDLSGDGLDDLIGAAPSAVLDVHTNTGGGAGFQRKVLSGMIGTGVPPKQIATGVFPFLGDPNPSIIVSFQSENQVRVVTAALGTPTFTVVDAMMEPFDVLAADVGNETAGVDELLIAGNMLFEASQNGNSFRLEPHSYARPGMMVAGDFLDDGFGNDVAFVDRNFAGPGLVTFIPGATTGLPDALDNPKHVGDPGVGGIAIGAGDFNGDGHADVAVLDNRDNHFVHIFAVLAGVPTEIATVTVGPNPVTSMVVADFNGDGLADILTAPGSNGDGVDLLLSN